MITPNFIYNYTKFYIFDNGFGVIHRDLGYFGSMYAFPVSLGIPLGYNSYDSRFERVDGDEEVQNYLSNIKNRPNYEEFERERLINLSNEDFLKYVESTDSLPHCGRFEVGIKALKLLYSLEYIDKASEDIKEMLRKLINEQAELMKQDAERYVK